MKKRLTETKLCREIQKYKIEKYKKTECRKIIQRNAEIQSIEIQRDAKNRNVGTGRRRCSG